jgi:hypothetical protein
MLTRPYTFISGQITLPDSSLDRTSTYPALHSLTRLNYLTRFFSLSDFYLPGLTRSYPAELPYLISSRSDICLPNCTRPPYPTSLPGHLSDILTRSGKTSLHPTAYPALPNHLTRSVTLQLTSPKSFLIGLPP